MCTCRNMGSGSGTRLPTGAGTVRYTPASNGRTQEELKQPTRSTAPPADAPMPADVEELTAVEFEKVTQFKVTANAHFQANLFGSARTSWMLALDVFDGRPGNKEQRAERCKIANNLAEVNLKMCEWKDALRWADVALSIEESNAKARFRKARALAEIGGPDDIETALAELRELASKAGGKLGTAERQLMARLQAVRRKSTKHDEARRLRDAFTSVDGLGLDESSASGAASGAPADAARVATAEEVEELRQAKQHEESADAAVEMRRAIKQLLAHSPYVAMPAFESVEFYCSATAKRAGTQQGGARFRANALVAQRLFSVPGGAALVNSLGYINAGPGNGGADDWWEAVLDEHEMRRRYRAFEAAFAIIKACVNAEGGEARWPPPDALLFAGVADEHLADVS